MQLIHERAAGKEQAMKRRHSSRLPAARGTAASRLFVGAMGCVLVLAFANRAAADGIAAFGVPVNAYGGFEAPCNRGEVLTGVWVAENFTGINPQCAVASNLSVKNTGVLEGWYGPPGWDPAGGGAQGLPCPHSAPMMLSIRVTTQADTNIGSNARSFHFLKLETFCGVDGSHPSLEKAGGLYVMPGPLGEGQLGGGTQFCPAGQVAVGIRGHFYSALEVLGLICGDPKIGSRGRQTINQAKPAPGKAGEAARAAASRVGVQPSIANALGTAPAVAVKNQANAAALSSQAPPPTTSPGALTLSPQSLAPKTLSGAASLSPQALPPKPSASAAALKAQPLPSGGLQQAPSSLR
jgi:hypothetical protein